MNNKARFLVFILALILLFFIGNFFHIDAQLLKDFFKKIPLIPAGLIFIVLYVIVTFFIWLSKDIFRFVSAVIFGAYVSTLLVWAAETINAFILFYFARFMGKAYVESKLKTARLSLVRNLDQASFLWFFLLRAVPLVPFRFLDLASGLANISFQRYLAVVILGSPLRIFWVQYVLAGVGMSIFGSPLALSEYLIKNKSLFIFSLGYALLVIIVALKVRKNVKP
jgi:uncharacterized membrane protein YdjX (TVP38/TMEM64 family)